MAKTTRVNVPKIAPTIAPAVEPERVFDERDVVPPIIIVPLLGVDDEDADGEVDGDAPNDKDAVGVVDGEAPNDNDDVGVCDGDAPTDNDDVGEGLFELLIVGVIEGVGVADGSTGINGQGKSLDKQVMTILLLAANILVEDVLVKVTHNGSADVPILFVTVKHNINSFSPTIYGISTVTTAG